MDLNAIQKQNSTTLSSVIPKGRRLTGQEFSKAINFQEALVVVNDLVFAKRGKYLSEAEVIVLKGAWDNDDYEEIAIDSPYSLNYLQRRVAPQLWDLLSEAIGNEERVSKKKFRHILLELVTKKYPNIKSLLVAKQSSTPVQSVKVLGGQLPDISTFYGRTRELTFLKELIVNQRCIALTGIAGIGKSTLAAKLITELSIAKQARFDCFIWKSVSHTPVVQELVADLIRLINPVEPYSNSPEYTQAMITMLLKQLQSRPCLVVLDECEGLFQTDNSEQKLEYRLLFRRLVEEQHQSCLLLTSRVWPNELDVLIENDRPIEHLKIEGLDSDAAMQFLYKLGLDNEEKACSQLIQTYRGNPLELRAVANRIHHFFAGSTEKFFKNKTTLLSSRFKEMLDKVFGQTLDENQRQIMIYLAEEIASNSQYTNFTCLLNGLKNKNQLRISTSELITAIEKLERQSLIESIKDPVTKEISFTLQPVIKKYIKTDPQGLVHTDNSRLAIAS